MMKKILVPFDGSETALRALEFAAGIGKPFGSEIMVVNVIVPYDYTKVPPRKPKNAIEEAEMAAKEPDPTPLDIAKGILDKLGCTTASYRLIVDIDPGEAQKLIKLLELLLKDWYIARHEREELYREILVIDEKKQDERHPD